VQVPPVLPQADVVVPTSHIPLVAAEQHPPLQGLLLSQAVPQTPLMQA
jgi:hypothetical protein